MKQDKKYIFVLGGVISGIGKGVLSSSLGEILQEQGFVVNIMKIDPYLNVDAGTMNPAEHGETFVLDSGLECDQDMGNYERMLHTSLSSFSYLTGGQVYKEVLDRERRLEYGGKCVQFVPHVQMFIKERIEYAAQESGADIQIVEIGGTVGDYESIVFLEALRVFLCEHRNNTLVSFVSYVPIPGHLGEPKTKPTQQAVRALGSFGVAPQMLFCRSAKKIRDQEIEKIACTTNIKKENVITIPDVACVFEIPLLLKENNVDEMIISLLDIKKGKKVRVERDWKWLCDMEKKKKEYTVVIAGKYFDAGGFVFSDVYISVINALKYVAAHLDMGLDIQWLSTQEVEESEFLKGDGFLVSGGFGERGVEGKLSAIKYARENTIPFFGICYGLQLATIECMRNIGGRMDANSVEIDPETPMPVVTLLDSQQSVMKEEQYGATMRLGGKDVGLVLESFAREIYGKEVVSERHRHRFYINTEYIDIMEQLGFFVSGYGVDDEKNVIEIMERKDHPFFVGVQFHSEFLSRPFSLIHCLLHF